VDLHGSETWTINKKKRERYVRSSGDVVLEKDAENKLDW